MSRPLGWWLRAALVLLLVLLGRGAGLHAEDKPLTARQKERLKERDASLALAQLRIAGDKLDDAVEAVRHMLAIEKEVYGDGFRERHSLRRIGPLYYGKVAELRKKPETLPQAVAAIEKMLPLERDAFGDDSDIYANSLTLLADMHGQRQDYTAARKVWADLATLRVKQHGKEHWQAVDARAAVAHCETLTKLTPAQRKRLAEADERMGQVGTLYKAGRFREAIDVCTPAYETRKELLGDKDGQTIYTLHNFAVLYKALRDFKTAETYYLRVAALRKQAQGETHPDHATALDNLGLFYRVKGEPARAAPLHRQAQDIYRKAHGEFHPDFALSLRNLAGVYIDTKKYAEAVALDRQVLDIYRKLAGDDHPACDDVRDDLASALTLLAEQLEEAGTFDAARAARKEAAALRARLHGPHSWQAADARRSLDDIDRLAKLDAGQRKRLAAAVAQVAGAKKLSDQGKDREAVEQCQRGVATLKELLGAAHPHHALALNSLALLYVGREEYARAEPLYEQALALTGKALGEEHPQYLLILHNLAQLRVYRARYAEAEVLFRKALEGQKKVANEPTTDLVILLNNFGSLYLKRGDFDQAEKLYRQALDLSRQLVGEAHPDYASVLNRLALLYSERGDFTQAEKLYLQTLAVWKGALGENHANCGTVLHNLADLYWKQGDYARAEPLYVKAIAIRKQAIGEKSPTYGQSLHNLANLYLDRGDYARAEPLYQEVLRIDQEVLGEAHPDYAAALSSLANLYFQMGDMQRARPLMERSLDISRTALGEDHPYVAKAMHNLAAAYWSEGDAARAEPLFRQALEVYRKTVGERHPDYATTLTFLAHITSAKDPAKGEPLYREILELRKQTCGEKHPDYAHALHDLGSVLRERGDLAGAEKLYRQAMDITRAALGADHPRTVECLASVAELCWNKGDVAQAEELCRRILKASRRQLDLTAASQSERQQLTMLYRHRHLLDVYLDISEQAGAPVEAAYAHVLAWKGAVSAQQRRSHDLRRLAREGKEPELAQALADVQTLSARLARLTAATPDPKDQDRWLKEVETLTVRKEQREAELARRSAGFRRLRATQQVTPEQLQAALPAGVALVDVLYRLHAPPPVKGRKAGKPVWHLTAFVLRPGQRIVSVDLGPAEPIEDAVDLWRRSLKRTQPVRGTDDPAARLRRLVWQPLEKHIQGAPVVLVSPDGPLTRLPLAALPGKDPTKYLVEEVAVAVVPVPQELPEWLTAPAPAARPALLVLGNVDFSAPLGKADPAGRPAVRGTERLQWVALPGTRDEMTDIRKVFDGSFAGGRVEVLEGTKATKSALREKCTGVRWLHLATHGYFAPPSVRPALAPQKSVAAGRLFQDSDEVRGFHPGLLAGLALAGANRQPTGDEEDGILTALEVEQLDLAGVELALLSACETGLGKTTAGEGLLGLQRSFHVAGCRTVAATLWSVDDAATRQLMARFYGNLWRKDKPLGKLAALREAQLWMLREGIKGGMVRGMVRAPEEDPKQPLRVPPYYWAAFVLSGDWR